MMMKTRRTTLPWLIMAIAIALGSCSKAREEIDTQQPTAPTSPYANTKHEIALDLTPSIGMGDLRAMGMTFDEGLRAVTFDVSGSGLKVQSSTDDWKTYIFFRKKGDNTNVGYATYEYEQGERVTYVENGVTKTKVILRPKDHIITLTGVPSPPATGEEWYIAGITGGGSFDPTTMSVRFSGYHVGNYASATRDIPFAFSWTPLTFEQRGATLMALAKPTFKPQGVMVKTTIKNTFDRPVGAPVDIFELPLWDNPTFNFSASSYTDSDLAAGADVRYDNIPAGSPPLQYKVYYQGWDPGETKTFLMWGMPVPGGTDIKIDSPSSLLFNTHTGKYATDRLIAQKTLQAGKLYRLSYEIRRPKLPIEYVTERNLAGGPGLTAVDAASSPGTQGPLRFADSDATDQSGYYNLRNIIPPLITQHSATDLMAQVVDGAPLRDRYYVPSAYNWVTIFPESDLAGLYSSFSSIEHMQIGDGSSARYYKFASDYKRVDGVVYGLRFRPVQSGDRQEFSRLLTEVSAGGLYDTHGNQVSIASAQELIGNHLRSAYRYRRDVDKIVVDVIYLGAYASDDLTTIADPQWWSDRADKIISRTFPLTGSIYPPPTLQGRGSTTHLITSNGNASWTDVWHALYWDNNVPLFGVSDYWMYNDHQTLRLFIKD